MNMLRFQHFAKRLKRDCRNITLHGFINISQSKSLLEMLFWLSVDALCFGLCLWLMAIHLLRYQSRPTVTTIKSTAFPISQIPFPAVTICNSNVVHKKQIEYYEDLLIKEGVNETRVIDFMKSLKYLVYMEASDKIDIIKFDDIDKILKKNKINSENLMRNVMHPCNEMLGNCTWSSKEYNCSDLFRPVKTGLGFCCSFNYFNDIADEDEPPGVFKQHVQADGAGLAHGLSVAMKIESEKYVSPILPFRACFVLIHPIWDFGDLATFSVIMQPGDLGLMQLVPTVFTADVNLRSVAVETRNCWFENEGNLKSTRDYSFTNCVNECKVRAIFEFCKCVPFFYSQDKRKQCTLQDITCLKKYELQYNSIKLGDQNVTNSTICNCLPKCEDISYDGYINLIRSGLQSNDSIMYIYFDHSWCVEYNKSLNLTWDMLLASLGGIFGLCLGGSLISLIECVYYLVKSICLAFLQGKRVSSSGKAASSSKKGSAAVVHVKPRY